MLGKYPTLLTNEEVIELNGEDLNLDNFNFFGIIHTNKTENEPLLELSKVILEKEKYRKLFLEKSFKEYVVSNLKKSLGDIQKLKDIKELDDKSVLWITTYKWLLRNYIPYISNFPEVNYQIYDIPFLNEWGLCIDLLVKEFKKQNIDFIEAIETCERLGLITKKYVSVFCKTHNAHIVCPEDSNIVPIHDKDCEGQFFEGMIYEVSEDFKEFWFKDKGTTFELWFYYVIILYILEKYGSLDDCNILRNFEVFYRDNVDAMTELDIFIMFDDNTIYCECKNKERIKREIMLKQYGIMNKFNIKKGILACPNEFKSNRISKDIAKNEFRIYIIDDLLNKSKDEIFEELEKVFED